MRVGVERIELRNATVLTGQLPLSCGITTRGNSGTGAHLLEDKMSSKITYKCDLCGRKLKFPEEHIRVDIHADMLNDNLDLCSWKCFKEYIDKGRQ